MFEHLLRLYYMSMENDVRSPTPHLFGPPGAGKSTVIQQLADTVEKTCHTINVSRISPLDLEGVQMPDPEHTKLNLLHATFWTQLQEGDILLFDEFLRGFPEVYNGLLDIFTSRQVGGLQLPKVFIVAASNSIVSYDKALEDRLLHIPVPDPRKKKTVKRDMAQRIVDALGLLPSMVDSNEMTSLLDTEVLPMYDILDQLDNRTGAVAASIRGQSIRKLIGQALLREIQSPSLQEMIDFNNRRAVNQGKYQYVFLTNAKHADPKYSAAAKGLVDNPKLSELQALNLKLNMQLLELERLRIQKEEPQDDDLDDGDIFEDLA